MALPVCARMSPAYSSAEVIFWKHVVIRLFIVLAVHIVFVQQKLPRGN